MVNLMKRQKMSTSIEFVKIKCHLNICFRKVTKDATYAKFKKALDNLQYSHFKKLL